MKIALSNKASSTLRVMLEPIGDTFDIGPLQTGELHLLEEDVQIDFCEDSFVSLWTRGDVKVLLNDRELSFPDIS